MDVLVTRPEPQATQTARKLAALGHRPKVVPMLVYTPLEPAPLPLDGVDAIVLTSQSVLPALRVHPDRGRIMHLPVHAVGPRTAEVARTFGFGRVFEGVGDVAALAGRLAALTDRPRCVLHPTGRHQAGDLAGTLAEAGIEVRSVPLYEMEPNPRAPTDLAPLAGPGALDAVLFYSPRTAEIFADALTRHPGLATLRDVPAFAISQQVADVLGATGHTRIHAASPSTEDALLDLLRLVDHGGSGAVSGS